MWSLFKINEFTLNLWTATSSVVHVRVVIIIMAATSAANDTKSEKKKIPTLSPPGSCSWAPRWPFLPCSSGTERSGWCACSTLHWAPCTTAALVEMTRKRRTRTRRGRCYGNRSLLRRKTSRPSVMLFLLIKHVWTAVLLPPHPPVWQWNMYCGCSIYNSKLYWEILLKNIQLIQT